MLVKGYNKDGRPQNVQFVLSLVTSQRVPVWYRPWDGNQSDDGVYLADMSALRKLGWLPTNVVLIGDRKLCNQATMLAFCRMEQAFWRPHPWTDTAKAVWVRTWQELQAGKRDWSVAEYVSRNEMRTIGRNLTQYRVCEMEQTLLDEQEQKTYCLRWVFSWSSRKAEQDAKHRQRALEEGNRPCSGSPACWAATTTPTASLIQSRIDQALKKAQAQAYFHVTLTGSDEDQAWELHWERQATILGEGLPIVLLILTLSSVLVFGQTETGSITGTVTDPQVRL